MLIIKYFRLFLLVQLLPACASDSGDPSARTDKAGTTVDAVSEDSSVILSGYVETDKAGNDQLCAELDPVRTNVRAINANRNWSKTENRELTETSEGGVATFYYRGDELKKIVATQYGEMFRKLSEFYLLDGKVSFVFEKTLRYNRPLLYDSTAMRENDDDQVFDLDKSVTEEVRSYFVGGKLVQRMRHRNMVAVDSLPGEEERLLTEYNKMMDLPVME